MSNNSVGSVYETIIKEVIEASRVDFEEAGVDDAALTELAKGWQAKLSAMKIAAFPWDPKPESASSAAQASQSQAAAPLAQAPNNYTQAQLSPPPHASPQVKPGSLNGMVQDIVPNIKTEHQLQQYPTPEPTQPQIKQEAGMSQVSQVPVPAYAGNSQSTSRSQETAAQRAAQNIHRSYGERAAASISAIQSGMPHMAPQQAPVQQQGQQPPQQALDATQQYRQSMAANAAAAMQQQQGQQRQQNQQQQAPPQQAHSNGLPQNQMDGVSDQFEGVLMRRDANGNPVEMGRVEIDNIIHAQIAARAKQMEGGGLMLPIRQAAKTRSLPTQQTDGGSASRGGGRFDGPDDIKEEDSDVDAINSDLDDPEDIHDDDEEDEEGSGQLMLCMYDKVQRVKNKWKCTLKDGVLNVNGKEYVFHKANGEYEW